MNGIAPPRLATVARWAARALSVLILGFWGFFILAHLVHDTGGHSRPLGASDYAAFAAMGAWLVGLILAWRWERAGGVLVLAAVLLGAALNPKVLHFPGTLVPVAGVLFLVSGWMRRPAAGAARMDET